MVARHGLVVRSAHYHAHGIGSCAVLGVVGVKRPRPHGGPHKVATQTQDEFEHSGIELVVAIVSAIRVLYPSGKTRSLVVEEYAAIFHSRLTRGIAPALYRHVRMPRHRGVGPVIPRRHPYLLR